MIPSARSTVQPVVSILFLRALKSTDVRMTRVKIIIFTGRDCGSAEWIIKHKESKLKYTLHLLVVVVIEILQLQ